MQKKKVVLIEKKMTWFRCPNCGKRLLQYDSKEGISKKIFLLCKQCKKSVEIIIN